jgi:hypothetical protein
MTKVKEYLIKNNLQIIMKTENPTLAKYLIKMGLEKLSYEKCKKKYPLFLKSYINKSKKTNKYYETQEFYIKANI